MTIPIHVCMRCGITEADYFDDEGFTWHYACYLSHRRARRFGGTLQVLCVIGFIVAIVIGYVKFIRG